MRSRGLERISKTPSCLHDLSWRDPKIKLDRSRAGVTWPYRLKVLADHSSWTQATC